MISMGFGGKTSGWDTQRDALVSRLRDYAHVAAAEVIILAGETHCGALVDRTERALWVLHEVDDPRIRLHFDIVHFFLAEETIEASVASLLPVTAHTHVTDAHKWPYGGFQFRLLGEGDLDLVAYVGAMQENGRDDSITVEVSTQVWSKEGFDPRQAAVSCYNALERALDDAGIRTTAWEIGS